MSPQPADDGVRVDKWLWAARFFKTRGLAAEAVSGGKVQVNGARVKRSKLVHPGDRLRLRKGPYEYQLTVGRVSEHRGSATVAATLYEETAESKKRRELLATQHKLAAAVGPRPEQGRPTKKDRRALRRLKGKDR